MSMGLNMKQYSKDYLEFKESDNFNLDTFEFNHCQICSISNKSPCFRIKLYKAEKCIIITCNAASRMAIIPNDDKFETKIEEIKLRLL